MTEPTIEVEPRSALRGGRRAGWRRWLLRGFAAALALALVPVFLTFLYLPSPVRPLSTLMLLDLAALRGYDRQYSYIEDLGPHIVNSVMMSEDGQFCAHRGVDWAEMSSVWEDFRAGGVTRGASTIPMQTVKNLFLWNGRSYIRKALEVPLAIYFDAVMPKKRIMEIYLNIAEWGPGIYGAEAAAQAYFGRPARDLSRRQAALLAVTLPNPYTRDPAKPGSGLSRLAGVVERRAARAGGYNGCVL